MSTSTVQLNMAASQISTTASSSKTSRISTTATLSPSAAGTSLPSTTVLRLKRRLEESPSKILVMSYKRCKRDCAVFDLSAPEEETATRVFRLAGTVNNDKVDDEKSITQTIKDALLVDENKELETDAAIDKHRRCKRRSNKLAEKVKMENKKHTVDNRFRVISKKRGLTELNDQNQNASKTQENQLDSDMFFNLLDLVEENESLATEKPQRVLPKVGSITMNGLPMTKEDISELDGSKKAEYVFDLYITTGGVVDDHIQDQFVSVLHADADYEFDFNQYGDSDVDLKLEEDEDDSNDESNWRNDYPDSDPDGAEEEGFAYGYKEQHDNSLIEQFSRVKLQGNELSSDDDGDYIYSTKYDGLDDGLGGMYNKYKSRLEREEWADEVVSSQSNSDEEC